METTSVDFSWLFAVLAIGLFVVLVILGARSRIRYMQRLQDAQSKGAFADLNMPANKSRFRRLVAIALISLLGSMVSSVILFLEVINNANPPIGILLIVDVIFAVIASVAGFLVKREINRRVE